MTLTEVASARDVDCAAPSRAGAEPLLVVAGVTAAAAAIHLAIAVVWLLPRQPPFGWDPANHAMWGLTIHHDLTRGNWISFAFDSYRQVYWPFLHSWLIAAAMLVLGPTATAARLVSLAAHAFTAVALALLAQRTAPRPRGLAPSVAVGLWLTAAAYLRRYGAEAFTESVAIAATAATLLVLSHALERRDRRLWAAAGVLTMATYFTKTDYGLVLGLATACVWVLDVRGRPGGDPLRLAAAWLLPVVVLSLAWFAYPPKIAATLDALVNRPQGPHPLSPEGAVYHLRQLKGWSDEPWTFALLLAALIASLASPRSSTVRAVGAYVAVALLLHTLSQTKDVKHVVKVLPWLFLLAGVQAARLWETLGATSPRRRWRILVGAALALLAVERVAGLAAELRTDRRNGMDVVAAALVQRLQPGRSHVVLGELANLSPHLVNWTLLAGGPPLALRPDPFTKRAEYGKEWLEGELEHLAERVPAVRLLERGPPARSIEVRRPWPRPRAGAAAPVDSILDGLLAEGEPDRVLVIAPDRDSPLRPVDAFLHDGAAFLPELARRPGYELAERTRFPELRLEILVFDRVPAAGERRSPPAAQLGDLRPAPTGSS